MKRYNRKPYKLKPYRSYRDKVRRRRKILSISLFFIILTAIIVAVSLKFSNNISNYPSSLFNKLEGYIKSNKIYRQEKNKVNKLDTGSLEGYYTQPDIIYDLYQDNNTPIKGVYVSGNKAGSSEISNIIELCNRTELNALVIDVKSDHGHLTFSTDNNIIRQAGIVPSSVPIKDIELLIEKLYLNNIYPIARIVTFKDNVIKDKYPDYMIKNIDGSFYQSNEPGNQKSTWLNPYNKDVWEYILTIGKEAARVGFKEIQFDYIRFHEGTSSDRVDFGDNSLDKSKTEIITDFTKYIVSELHKEGVKVSADVFGAIITSKFDAEIVGQDYVQLSRYLDYICPMVYPSHYAKDSFGVENPDLDPYSIILGSMLASKNRLKEIKEEENIAIVRPWLQDFTASWMPVYKNYGPDEIREQIQGVYDAGLNEWLLWNASNRYTEGGLLAK